jgi:hypothetical protein
MCKADKRSCLLSNLLSEGVQLLLVVKRGWICPTDVGAGASPSLTRFLFIVNILIIHTALFPPLLFCVIALTFASKKRSSLAEEEEENNNGEDEGRYSSSWNSAD